MTEPAVPYFTPDATGDAMEAESEDPAAQAALSALQDRVRKLYADPIRHITQRTEEEVFELMATWLNGAKLDGVAVEEIVCAQAPKLALEGAQRRQQLMQSARQACDGGPGNMPAVVYARLLCVEILTHWVALESALGPHSREVFMAHTRRMMDWGDEPPEFDA